jgi:ABC-type bacteriocin/lantibiotic exporter with double-glycine peptidase domain
MKFYAPLVALAVLVAFALVPAQIQAQDTTTTSISSTLNQIPAIVNSLGSSFNQLIQAFTSQQGLNLLMRNIGLAGTVFINSFLNSGLNIVNYVIYACLIGLIFPLPVVGWLCTVPITAILAAIVEAIVVLAQTLQALFRP